MSKGTIIEIIVALFILLFAYAAFSKLLDYQKFTVQIGQSPMLTSFAGFWAWSIPSIELLICVFLLMPRTKMIAMYAAFSLMTMFTVYIVLASQFSDYVPCSCGGVLQNLTWTEHLIFNMIFVALGFLAIFLHTKVTEDSVIKNTRDK